MSELWVGPVALAGIALAWVLIQAAWKRTFPEAGADPDPLARRMDCHKCSRSDACERPHDAPGGRCGEEAP